MFFTDRTWKASFQLTGAAYQPFDRWSIVGVEESNATFVVRSASAEDGWQGDTYSLLVAGAELLLSLLDEFGYDVPKVYVLERSELKPVIEIRSYYPAGETERRHFAYRSFDGPLVACGAGPSPDGVATSCMWSSSFAADEVRS